MVPQHRRVFKKARGRMQNVNHNDSVVSVSTETFTHTVVEQVAANDAATVTQVTRRSLVRVLIVHINIARPVCNLMFGPEHKPHHRIMVGGVVAGFGVFIAHYFAHVESALVEGLADFFGYGLHGLGLTPIIETLTAHFERDKVKE